MSPRGHLLVIVPLLLACSRPRLSADDGGTTTNASGTGSTSEGGSDGDGEDGSDSSDSGTTGPDFVPEPDLDPGSRCDLFAQDCPEGEKCVPYGSGFEIDKCVPVLGDRMPSEPCHFDEAESTDDCDATSFCWDGTCAAFCTGTIDEPQCADLPGCSTYSCLINGDATIALCVEGCDVLAQDCSSAMECHWIVDHFGCVIPLEDQADGELCTFGNECLGGSTCVESQLLPDCPGVSCCTSYCDPAALVDPCPQLLAGTSCVAFEEAAQAQPGCAVGRCLAPP